MVCSLAIVNPPILPGHAFCIVHRDVRYYNDTIIELPKVTPNPETSNTKRSFPSESFVCSTKISRFLPTDLILPPEYFHFLNAKHLSLLRQELGYVLRL